jgi:hypothetical protein
MLHRLFQLAAIQPDAPAGGAQVELDAAAV